MASQSPIHYLTADDIWVMNQTILQANSIGALLLDHGKLTSACARPINFAMYEGADLARQAALLVEGVAQP